MSFASALFAASDPFQFLLDSINGIVPGLGTFIGFITGNILPIMSGVGAMIVPTIWSLVTAFYAWAAAAIPAAVATVAAMAPLLLLGAAVAVLTAAWMNNWGGIREITASVWATIQPYLSQLVDWLVSLLPPAILLGHMD